MNKRFSLRRRPYWISTVLQLKLVQPAMALIALVATLGMQWMPGLFVLQAAQAQERAQAQQKRAQAKAAQQAVPRWAQNRPMGPQGSKPGKVKPSEPSACKDCEVSMESLDLSRVPTEKELRMAGQLGGALSPTSNADVSKLQQQLDQDLKRAGFPGGLRSTLPPTTPAGAVLKQAKDKVKRLQEINLDFGIAIQEWNEHKFKTAAKKFEEHVIAVADEVFQTV